jgi:hypothetical protein
MIAKYDHAGQYETHGGAATSSLYGGRDKDFADAVQEAISKDPPGGLSGGFGGFKVIQSDVHQLVYGADPTGICKSSTSLRGRFEGGWFFKIGIDPIPYSRRFYIRVLLVIPYSLTFSILF